MAPRAFINIGSGQDILPDGSKQLFNQCWFIVNKLWFEHISINFN